MLKLFIIDLGNCDTIEYSVIAENVEEAISIMLGKMEERTNKFFQKEKIAIVQDKNRWEEYPIEKGLIGNYHS